MGYVPLRTLRFCSAAPQRCASSASLSCVGGYEHPATYGPTCHGFAASRSALRSGDRAGLSSDARLAACVEAAQGLRARIGVRTHHCCPGTLQPGMQLRHSVAHAAHAQVPRCEWRSELVERAGWGERRRRGQHTCRRTRRLIDGRVYKQSEAIRRTQKQLGEGSTHVGSPVVSSMSPWSPWHLQRACIGVHGSQRSSKSGER